MDRTSANTNPDGLGARFGVVALKTASLLIAGFLGLAAGRYGGAALYETINPPESSIPSVTPPPPVEEKPEPPPAPEEKSTRREETIEERLKRQAMKELRKRIRQAEREIRKRAGIGEDDRKR